MAVKFTDNSVQVEEALNRAVEAFLHEAAGALVSQTKRNSNHDSGELMGSWGYQIKESDAQIGSPLENALWEEFGTGAYALHGDGRKGAWYVPVEAVTGDKRPAYNGKVTIVYGKNGKKFYKTNGKRAKRALYTAFNTMKTKIIKQAETVLKATMGGD